MKKPRYYSYGLKAVRDSFNGPKCESVIEAATAAKAAGYSFICAHCGKYTKMLAWNAKVISMTEARTRYHQDPVKSAILKCSNAQAWVIFKDDDSIIPFEAPIDSLQIVKYDDLVTV